MQQTIITTTTITKMSTTTITKMSTTTITKMPTTITKQLICYLHLQSLLLQDDEAQFDEQQT